MQHDALCVLETIASAEAILDETDRLRGRETVRQWDTHNDPHVPCHGGQGIDQRLNIHAECRPR